MIRPVRWPDDAAGLAALDTSFTTGRVYRALRGPLAFLLVAERVEPPIRKSYGSLADHSEQLRRTQHVVVSEDEGVLTGVAAADLVAWNNRVRVEHLYVAPGARRRGVGRALMASVVEFARERGARCVWLETQTVNYPAARFYQRLGFRLCGFDDRLYDADAAGAGEIALFFALDLPASRAPEPGG